jgi:hypothetical protein
MGWKRWGDVARSVGGEREVPRCCPGWQRQDPAGQCAAAVLPLVPPRQPLPSPITLLDITHRRRPRSPISTVPSRPILAAATMSDGEELVTKPFKFVTGKLCPRIAEARHRSSQLTQC